MLPSRYFYDLTQPEIAGQLKKNPLVILPAGSVEQRGRLGDRLAERDRTVDGVDDRLQ